MARVLAILNCPPDFLPQPIHALMLRMHLAAVFCVALNVSPIVHADEGVDFFESKIRPVLIEHCYKCHSHESNSFKGGLALDTRELMRQGGESGPGVVPGELDKSLILEAIKYESFEMPPDSKLDEKIVRHFEQWIEMGAPDPREGKTDEINARDVAEIDWDTAKEHWAFQSPQKQDVQPQAGSQTRVDDFVRAKLNESGLEPNPQADDRTLLRRIYFDVTGLPPTPEQAEEFFAMAKVNRQQAITQLVDDLLASAHYGERWAALWLDVMRYAEDQAHIVGNNKALFYPNAYMYRDWVIQSFNDDMPYDDFVKLQLAADQITPEDGADDVALGFIGLGPKYYRRNAPEVMADEYEDRVDTVSRGLLGLTVACARCHDHKYDPIPTEDYYALAGVFASTEMFNKPLNEDVEKKGDQAKDPDQSIHVVRDKDVKDLNVMIRGDVNVKGEVVPRRFLQVLSEAEPVAFQQGSGRLELAEHIADAGNPLTARVIVNRIWGQYFGQPLVSTYSNFGKLGDVPTHPKLLDDLAARFMEHGWSLKWLHREILLSATYQQSSDIDPAKAKVDEANRSLWRMNRRRLKVEQWRDALLSVSGELDSAVGGKSLTPTKPEERRRTVYSERSRFELNPLLARFDFPDPNAHAASRVETTTPLQKLFVMNSPLMSHFVDQLLKRLEPFESQEEKINRAYQLAYARTPDEHEVEIAKAYLETGTWHEYVHVLLAANEFYILD